MNANIIRWGFLLAGAVNIIGITLVSHGLQSNTLTLADPAVFSRFGILMIMLWGMAYIGTAQAALTSVLLPATFALEKLAYTINWWFWISEHADSTAAIIEQDLLGGLFLAGYGINDGLFGLFFAAVAWRNWRSRQ